MINILYPLKTIRYFLKHPTLKGWSQFPFFKHGFRTENTASTTTLELKSRFNDKWNNNLVLGYSSIHDYRDPTSSNAMFPQVEILITVERFF
jgi:hypothetical protein